MVVWWFRTCPACAGPSCGCHPRRPPGRAPSSGVQVAVREPFSEGGLCDDSSRSGGVDQGAGKETRPLRLGRGRADRREREGSKVNKLRAQTDFEPLPVAEGDELYPNGIFE